MGIFAEAAGWIRDLKLPDGFAVCDLGDQRMCGQFPAMKAEAFYRAIGCGHYVSIDGNGQGTVNADLNQPLDVELGTFDLVTDFGTGEHIFDQAQVWRSIHNLIRPGGYLAFDRPSQGYGKHGFYQTNVCLLEDLAAANRYKVIHLKLATTPRGRLVRGLFRVPRHAVPFVVPQQGRYQRSLRLQETG